MDKIIQRVNHFMQHYLWATYLSLTVLLVAMHLVHFVNLQEVDNAGNFLVVLVLMDIMYLGVGIVILRLTLMQKFSATLEKEADKYFFHGFRLSRYIKTFAFWRLQKWLGSGRCYELSVLSMIVLKNNKTAVLCRGNSYDKDGNFQTRHSWVEFKDPLNGQWVVDFAWINTGFAPKKDFLKATSADGGRLEVRWSCTYDEFWSTLFVGALCEAMKTQKTSNVYRILGVFGSVKDEEYGFSEYCYSEDKLQYAACRYMMPYYDCDDNPMSSLIIRDFVKNPKRKQPKARSIRLTQFGIREYEKWKARQAQTATTT